MITCASCKNKTSKDRCSNKPLRGLIFCGTHVKVKNPRLWKDENNADSSATLIQKLWRGYSVRNWLTLAGPGVLNRSVCHNEEELVTFDEKKSVSPLDYFAFEEAGKVYWFDVRSLAENGLDKLEPTNPYTRQPLTIDTRRRLRELCVLRKRFSMDIIHDGSLTKSKGELILGGWTCICQILGENGFSDMSPMYFTELNRSQLFIFLSILRQDFVAWAAEHTSPLSRRHRYVYWIKKLQKEYAKDISVDQYSYIISRILISILNDQSDPYSTCFMIMSALHRL